MKINLFIVAYMGMFLIVSGQRQYASGSVLSSGQWLKVSVERESIYKITGEMLEKAGFPASSNSNNIHVYGNGGSVLPEGNDKIVLDDLAENAIYMNDGGDGKFDASDWLLFYAEGPDVWQYDSNSHAFNFLHHPFSDRAYYFIQVNTIPGKRMKQQPIQNGSGITVNEYDEHYHHELDSVNLLKSGREWFGEELNQQLGVTTRVFSLPFSNVVVGKPVQVNSEVIGRSSGQVNLISFQLNNNTVFEHTTQTLIGTLTEPAANLSNMHGQINAQTDRLDVKYLFTPGSVNARAWINWFELRFRRSLDMNGMGFLRFRDMASVGKGNLASYNIKNVSSNIQVWDLTNPFMPDIVKTTTSGTQLIFNAKADQLHEYVAFDPAKALTPEVIGTINNQNLHSVSSAQMVIITEKSLLPEAERLAAFHRQHDGLTVYIADIGQIFNEFSSGSTDPSAIRNFMKMLYDRTGNDPIKKPQYLLLMGGSSYIYKGALGLKYNQVPSYQSVSSLDPLTSYVSDDFFGFLDDGDDINKANSIPLMDISIGRIPARNAYQAKVAVDKIINYHAPASLGNWRNTITFVADDEDYNVHLNDAEDHSKLIKNAAPNLTINKIYLDAYQQESGSGGSRYPLVNKAINQAVDKGTLIWNYSGHGGSIRLAQEAILDKDMTSSWNNASRLPLFITATCDFAPFDDHTQFSIGEDLFVGHNNGAIGLLTTTRLVFASSNKITNNNYLKYLLQKDLQGRYPTIGKSLADSKNFTVSTTGDYINARKFILLGDPAMKIALPEMNVTTTLINGKSPGSDTLKTNGEYTFYGEVRTVQGLLASDFNGVVYPTFYAQSTLSKTLVNDPQSRATTFEEQKNKIFEGKVKVVNGKFNFTCIMPSDLDPAYATGRMSYYAENGKTDASGAENAFILGGKSAVSISDATGPSMKCYLNDSLFTNGSTVAPSSTLFVTLNDISGINISGLAIGHDISATLDGDFRKTWFLNDSFEPSFTELGKGSLQFVIPEMEEGSHALTIRAWDNFNNSSTCELHFKVMPIVETHIENVKLYPNPTWNSTAISFALSGLAGVIDIELQVFTSSGTRIKTIHHTINIPVGRSIEVGWNGLDEMGKKPQKGIYLCRVVVKNAAGRTVQKVQKLILM